MIGQENQQQQACGLREVGTVPFSNQSHFSLVSSFQTLLQALLRHSDCSEKPFVPVLSVALFTLVLIYSTPVHEELSLKPEQTAKSRDTRSFPSRSW